MPSTTSSHDSNDILYVPTPTAKEFHKDDSFVRALIGPIGSGKSVACSVDIMKRAAEQVPFNNIRRSRWAVIRNTYRELVDTTQETFFSWFPSSLGLYKVQDAKFTIKQKLPDDTILYTEILFRALDKPGDIKKLLSLELTGGWLNECREIPKAVLDMLMGRVGRYPPKWQGGPDPYFGVIMDTNPPDSDHWFYKLFEEIKPHNHKLFHQPSGLDPSAENIDNLPPDYYYNMMAGKDKEWINVYVHGKYGFVSDGKPIYPEYNDDIHFIHHSLIPDPTQPLYIGLDFGLTPAAAIAQKDATYGQWKFIDEVCSSDLGALQFGEILGRHLREHYRDYTLIITGDPGGDERSQNDKRTAFEILHALGIDADPAHTNDFTIRRETFARPLTRMTFNGEPGLVLGPNCKMLRKGLAGGYKYKRLAVSGEERYKDMPDKQSIYSHICDAAQYLLLGAGEDDQVLGSSTHNPDLDYTALNRAAG